MYCLDLGNCKVVGADFRSKDVQEVHFFLQQHGISWTIPLCARKRRPLALGKDRYKMTLFIDLPSENAIVLHEENGTVHKLFGQSEVCITYDAAEGKAVIEFGCRTI